MVMTEEQIEEHDYVMERVEEGEIGTEYHIFVCSKPGCLAQKIEEFRNED